MGSEVRNPPPGALAKRSPAALTMGDKGFNFDFDSALRFASEIIDAGMAPKGISKPGAVVGLIQAGRELGLPPMMALANLTFTNGRVGIMGDAAKALIRSGGHLKEGTDFVETYSGEEGKPSWTCTVTAHRKGHPAPFVSKFTLQDAINAKLVRIWNDGSLQSATRDGYGTDGPWAKYTKRMLKYRALGFLCKDHFSDVLLGCVVDEELRDYPAASARGDAPAGPDPLLAAAVVRCDGNHSGAVCGDPECWQTPLETEVIDDVPAASPAEAESGDTNGDTTKSLDDRTAMLIERIRTKKTRDGLASAMKKGEALQRDLEAAGRGLLLDRIQSAYDDQLRKIGTREPGEDG